MTAQLPDTIQFAGLEYAIAGVNGQGLFEPTRHGIFPIATLTACWRGHICHYDVAEGRLLLDRLQVSLGNFDGTGRIIPAPGPLLNGVSPVFPAGPQALLNNAYSGLGLAIAFTGRLQAGRDFIPTLNVHMGFQPPWKYGTVIELAFQAGMITAAEDASARFEALRETMTSHRK